MAALLVLSTVAVTRPANAALEAYNVDPEHTAVTFSIRHLFSKVPGRFSKLQGTIQLDEADLTSGSVEFAIEMREIGVGQILPTSKATDGTKDGYDLHLTQAIADATGLPVIASGGAGTLEHFYEAVAEGRARRCWPPPCFTSASSPSSR